MSGGHHPIAAGTQAVEVRVPGANCPQCFNDAITRVRDLAGVVDVHASITGECIEVQHRDASLPLVVQTLRTYLHGTDDSSHECQMVSFEPEVITAACGSEPVAVRHAYPNRPVPMETMVEATHRLRAEGYGSDFSASAAGDLVCRACGTSYQPESIEIDHIVRFEGDSNPDDQAILFALRCADGSLGQFSSAFGAGTPVSDANAMERLHRCQ